NNEPTAVTAISHVKPSIYVKGEEYKDHDKDVTGKISEEVETVKKFGGQIYYTDDIVFSSSSLINQFIEQRSEELEVFLTSLKKEFSANDIIEKLETLKKLKVVIIGDAIIDEYQYVTPLGQSGKGLHMSAVCKENDVFLGGSFAVANHLAEFVDDITLITSVGKECLFKDKINQDLSKNIKPIYIPSINQDTLTKKRYVMKDGQQYTKLFETYSSNDQILNNSYKKNLIEQIRKYSENCDLLLVTDFGNGFIDDDVAEEINKINTFKAINAQTNSGNRGFNLITKYQNASFISINEPEARLATHLSQDKIDKVIEKLSKEIKVKNISITSGVRGVLCFSDTKLTSRIPALSTNAVDRVGAGDSYLALASVCLAAGWCHELSGFLGAMAAAMNVQTIGNQVPTKKSALSKFLIRLMK
ncbi:MAG: cytidyltransferase, partial [Chlamydiae bacterium]|nr:cytidyltransferase [Chlamydiota bacterium]